MAVRRLWWLYIWSVTALYPTELWFCMILLDVIKICCLCHPPRKSFIINNRSVILACWGWPKRSKTLVWFHVCWQTLCALRIQARSIHFQKESRQFFLESTLVPRRPFSSNYINYIVQSSKLALYYHTNSTIDYSNVKDSQPFATFDGCCRGQACASTHQTLRMIFSQRQGISISKLISCVTLWCLCCVFRFASINQMQASHCLSSVRWQRLPRGGRS